MLRPVTSLAGTETMRNESGGFMLEQGQMDIYIAPAGREDLHLNIEPTGAVLAVK